MALCGPLVLELRDTDEPLFVEQLLKTKTLEGPRSRHLLSVRRKSAPRPFKTSRRCPVHGCFREQHTGMRSTEMGVALTSDSNHLLSTSSRKQPTVLADIRPPTGSSSHPSAHPSACPAPALHSRPPRRKTADNPCRRARTVVRRPGPGHCRPRSRPVWRC